MSNPVEAVPIGCHQDTASKRGILQLYAANFVVTTFGLAMVVGGHRLGFVGNRCRDPLSLLSGAMIGQGLFFLASATISTIVGQASIYLMPPSDQDEGEAETSRMI